MQFLTSAQALQVVKATDWHDLNSCASVTACCWFQKHIKTKLAQQQQCMVQWTDTEAPANVCSTRLEGDAKRHTPNFEAKCGGTVRQAVKVTWEPIREPAKKGTYSWLRTMAPDQEKSVQVILPSCWVWYSQRMLSWRVFQHSLNIVILQMLLSTASATTSWFLQCMLCWGLRFLSVIQTWWITGQLVFIEDHVVCQHVSPAVSTAERVLLSSDAISQFDLALKGPLLSQVVVSEGSRYDCWKPRAILFLTQCRFFTYLAIQVMSPDQYVTA